MSIQKQRVFHVSNLAIVALIFGPHAASAAEAD
jgi:hypothetical protein